jgi:hypothetical protein
LYNKIMDFQTLRMLLAIYLIVTFALTISYLRYRRCSALEYLLWGTLALVVPVLGPFFVIAARPGPRKPARRPGLIKRAIASPKG